MNRTVLCIAALLVTCSLAAGQQYKVLYSFEGFPDGENPVADLVFDQAGNIYGTTLYGGAAGGGTVFELSPGTNGNWSETILYDFCSDKLGVRCLDGYLPSAGLVLDSAGDLYGTTEKGGSPNCPPDLSGCGTVFKISPPLVPGSPWTETVLYNFCSNEVNNQCLDGSLPLSQLVLDASGNLYGTTTNGGSGHSIAYPDQGVVFELSPGANGWTETVLYNFCSLGQGNACPDGAGPQAGVTRDKAGSLYGTTSMGGAPKSVGSGTVYELAPAENGWAETVLYAFRGGEQGGSPFGTVSFDPRGNLYSTVAGGGTGEVGGVFRLTPKGGEYTFSLASESGGYPVAGVVVDSKRGALYGTASRYGLSGIDYYGTVFKIVSAPAETVLYSFCSQTNCTDGYSPVAGLVEDQAGNLYGTAQFGGMGTFCDGGCGVVFEIVQSPFKP
ncbi:MAG TPA: choice-of-anchor tandem repeat GloVer-containing protein [Terriglobales bacterium]|nr:choice-of-anchor tandem repeat GloVer-containing protein [Terriglobales bacterium]